MKNHTFTILLGWLLFLTSNLFAQNHEGLFKLKEGDWFEVQVVDKIRMDNNKRVSSYKYTSHLLRYQLLKQFPNNSQQYKVSIEQLKVWQKPSRRMSLGYDSYYPFFEENKTTPEIKNQFFLEVSPSGKISRFDPSKSNKSSSIILNEIGSVYGRKTFMKSEQNMEDSLIIRNLSSVLMLPIGQPDFKRQTNIYKYSNASLTSRTETKMAGIKQAEVLFKDSLTLKIPYQNNTGIPMLINLPDIQFVLTKASFPLESNTIIHGITKDQINLPIKIYMLGAYSESYFTGKQFRTDNNGSFICPIFLNRPYHLKITVGNKTLTSFLEPGDTLDFTEIEYLAHQISPINSQSQIDYFSEIKKKTESLSGKAEYNTKLSNEINQYRHYSLFFKDEESIVTQSQEADKKVNKLINSYQGKASDACLDYFRRDWNYFLATERLKFYEESRIPSGQNTWNDVLTIKEYPADFFLGVDTMPILMNPFEWNNSYQNFLTKAHHFKQERLGYSIGKWQHQDFLENYFFTQASLSGFPLYYQIAQLIRYEYKHNSTKEDFIEPYYQSFINNCLDPVLIESLKEVHENAMQLKIGREFPIKSFVLRDSSIFSLEMLKGKPICLILLRGPNTRLNDYKEIIEKFKTEEIEFLFARQYSNYYFDEKKDSTIIRCYISPVRLQSKEIF
jgi:hypothetical protein